MKKFQDRMFTASYNRLMFITFGVVLVVAFALVGIQVQNQSAHEEEQLVDQFRTSSLALDNLIVSVGEHLDVMQRKAQAWYLDPARSRSRLYGALAATGPGQYALDSVPAPYAATDVGNLTGEGDLAALPPAATEELEMALSLNAVFPGVQQNIPNAAWVYYTSQRRFINIYPWVSSGTARFAEKLYLKPFYQIALPANNPKRETRWTPLYVDEYGKGMMVTATKPVYHGDEFLGAVSIDITLDELTAYVRGFHHGQGRLMIINEGGELIAHPTATSSKDTRVKRLDEVLAEPLRAQIGGLLATQTPRPAQAAGHLVMWYGMKHAPWKVVYVEAEQGLFARTLDRAGVDFLVLLASLGVMLVAMRISTFREFIHPAERLVRHIFDESQDRAGPVPPVPRPWLPWFGEVSRAFGQNRMLIEEINRKNQQLTDMNIALARYTPRVIVLVSLDTGCGATTAAHLFADTLARGNPSKKTVMLEFPHPGEVAEELGLDPAVQVYEHPNGYDLWTSYDLGQVPEAGISSLLMTKVLHKYDNVVIHARIQGPAEEFVDRQLEPMLRYAKAIVLVPSMRPAPEPAHRALARHLRKSVRQDRANVWVLANRVDPQAPPVADADFEIPHVAGPRWLTRERYESPADAAAVVGTLVDRVERVHQISAFIPTTTAVDRPLDTQAVMQRTLNYFTRTFGGATSSQAEGAWRSDSAGVVSERVYLVVSYTTEEGLSRHVDEVIDYMKQVKAELSQEAMAIEIDRKLILV